MSARHDTRARTCPLAYGRMVAVNAPEASVNGSHIVAAPWLGALPIRFRGTVSPALRPRHRPGGEGRHHTRKPSAMVTSIPAVMAAKVTAAKRRCAIVPYLSI